MKAAWQNISNENISAIINGVPYEEEWAAVTEFDNMYEISSFGRVRSLYYNKRTVNGVVISIRAYPKILKSRLNTKGKYVFVRIGFREAGHKIKNKSVHRIVAKHFISDYSELLEVNHKDGDRFNNHYSNLEMNTRQQNMEHAWRTGLVNIAYGKWQSRTKLTDDQVMEIYKSKELAKDLSKKYKICRRQVWMIRSGRNWSHLTLDKE